MVRLGRRVNGLGGEGEELIGSFGEPEEDEGARCEG